MNWNLFAVKARWQRKVKRARVLLLADESSEGLAKTDEEIFEVLGMSVSGIEELF